MALDILLFPADARADRGKPITRLPLADERVYWFLHPVFEGLRERTGKYIDLYGDARFAANELVHLQRVLEEGRKLDGVTAAVRDFLDQLESMVRECERIAGVIEFVGD